MVNAGSNVKYLRKYISPPQKKGDREPHQHLKQANAAKEMLQAYTTQARRDKGRVWGMQSLL